MSGGRWTERLSDSDEVADRAPDGESVEAGVLPTSAATMDDAQLCRLVEALIFAADRPKSRCPLLRRPADPGQRRPTPRAGTRDARRAVRRARHRIAAGLGRLPVPHQHELLAVGPAADRGSSGPAVACAARDARDRRVPAADHTPRDRRHPRRRLVSDVASLARSRADPRARQARRGQAARSSTARRKSSSISSASATCASFPRCARITAS